eukprot:COSAG05_NODE_377_length_10608_cov_17.523361_5_plen_131_part_00
MGWRSWNAYGGGVNQSKMTGTMDRMAERTRAVAGGQQKMSLLDLGYDNVGLDDNWQACGSLNGQRSFHAADGSPLINNKTFPSLGAMVAHGHSLGLRVGWCESRSRRTAQQRPAVALPCCSRLPSRSCTQ